MLVPLSRSCRSQSCKHRAKSRAKFARHHKGSPARRGSERLTQSQKVGAEKGAPAAKLGPGPRPR
jgi:hypothetical protein